VKKSLGDNAVFAGASRPLPGGTAVIHFFRNNGSILLERTDELMTAKEKFSGAADVDDRRSLYDNFRHYLVSTDVHSSHCLLR